MISVSLFYIHEKGIVHRDIKPQNILVSKFGGISVFKLTDFGISHSDKNGKNFATVANLMSPFYSSIEQIDEEDAH